MAETTTQAPTQPAPTRGGRDRRRRREGRGGRGGQVHSQPANSSSTNTESAALTTPPTAPSGPATPTPPPLAEHTTTEQTSNARSGTERGGQRKGGSGQRSRGRGRARGRGPAPQAHISNGTGRRFGGQLTSDTGFSLQAEAPVFVPGRPVQPPSVRRRRESVLASTAPDIATRTHENIRNGLYECLICMNEIMANSKIWSCRTCWKVFHLSCIKKWSHNEGSTMAQERQGADEISHPRQWRCPGCNLPKDEKPTVYSCWCEKEVDPRPMGGVPPHSCGQSCGKERSAPRDCPHPCDQLCHAGPCASCTYMGPEQSCFCGKNASRKRCIDTNYKDGWSCGEICGEIMPCAEHTCTRPCHEGFCGACEIPIEAQCYCGKESKHIICNDKEDERNSEMLAEGQPTSWTGLFSCLNVCERRYDCGEHGCEKSCHAQDLQTAHCPLSPDQVTHCHCGKNNLDSLGSRRETCKDPIPGCGSDCGKTLDCGHLCKKTCHGGWCPPCTERTAITCRCGRITTNTICHRGAVEPPMCMRTCKALLNCGRHDCGEHCCPGEKKASERQASKRKLRPLGATARMLDEHIEAEHICTRLCGRALKCGNHTCPELCHRGPCGACREAIFEEISCHCGRTILSPPLPCGTNPPLCRFDCGRRKACGHPQIQHNCHGDDLDCPKCPYLVEKPCMCGKKTLLNQQCWLSDVRCGEICGKKLRCGSHTCQKPCHRPGECEDSTKHCEQQCGKEKNCCGHPCEERCHAPSSCKEEKPCQSKLLITCDCQNLKTETKCLSSKTNDGNKHKTLKCDDECARLQRNHQLALALNIDPSTHTDEHVPYSKQTLNLYQEHLKWAHAQEREMRIFAADEDVKRLRFKPMPRHYRQFVHSLAEDFGFDSESLDPEPHRHVALFKTPKFVKAPMKTLAECVRVRTTTALASQVSTSTARLEAPNDPFNGYLLTIPRFGLTVEELRAGLSSALKAAPMLSFDIAFLPSEEIILKAKPSSSTTTITPPSLEAAVKSLKARVVTAITSQNLAAAVYLCSSDGSLNILRRERDKQGTESGWSQVAAKAAGPKVVPKMEGWGAKNSFMVLSKKKRLEARKEDVVDDWEQAVDEEKAASESKAEASHEVTVNDEANDNGESVTAA